ncbi:MAG: hypothetical protein ACRDQ4_17590 [Pseudonocardiaceae bacterium]
MYRVVTYREALKQIAARPAEALPCYTEVLGVLELAPSGGRPYNEDKPDGPMRESTGARVAGSDAAAAPCDLDQLMAGMITFCVHGTTKTVAECTQTVITVSGEKPPPGSTVGRLPRDQR